MKANGYTICSDVIDTSFNVMLPRDVYNISITQSNDIGSTVSGLVDGEFVYNFHHSYYYSHASCYSESVSCDRAGLPDSEQRVVVDSDSEEEQTVSRDPVSSSGDIWSQSRDWRRV